MLAAGRTYSVGRSALSVSRCTCLSALATADCKPFATRSHGATRGGRAHRNVYAYPSSSHLARQKHSSKESIPGSASAPSDEGLVVNGNNTEPKTAWLRYQNMMYKRIGLPRQEGPGLVRGPGAVTAYAHSREGSSREASAALDASTVAATPPATALPSSSATVTPPTETGAANGETAPSPEPAAVTTAGEGLRDNGGDSTTSGSGSVPQSGAGDRDLTRADQLSPLRIPSERRTTHAGAPISLSQSEVGSSDSDLLHVGESREAASSGGVDQRPDGDLEDRRRPDEQREGQAVVGTSVSEGEDDESRPKATKRSRRARQKAKRLRRAALLSESASSSADGSEPRGTREEEGGGGDGGDDATGVQRKRRPIKERAGGGGGGGKGEAGATGGDGGGESHYQQPGSAWQNVHARQKLGMLLKGLPKDYGVQEILGQHHVGTHTLSKLLPLFRNMVLRDPDAAFPGESGQEVQKAISDLCYHEKFHSGAVLMRKPIKARSSTGRQITFPSSLAGTGREAPFVRERNKLVKESFIPRLIKLAQPNFREEINDSKHLDSMVDLRNPHQAFPMARLRKRRIIYHGGPTNSGKTYQAIERLKKAGANRKQGDGPAGLFCGPLRLLALEVYEQLNSQGVYCSLMTGQEKREVPFATHVSCTIEMASTTNEYEVAVIDEIQMLADEQRGPSWTAALLGLNCPEIHVCGGMEGADLVEAMAKEMGDDFELREYQRKTELVCAEKSILSYNNIQPGDAVVAFSRRDIFSIKKEIESKTPYKCCVIYGSLPQETRAHQARLFNSEDTEYDVLVASDAIGMGLNLNIRRVVFHAVSKRHGKSRGAVKLPPTMLKQIGGRAGRHGKQWEFGEVTCLRASDMGYMNQVMNTPLEPIPKAAIFPSVQRMQEFSNLLDKMEPEAEERRRLAETFAAFADRAKVGDRYFLGTHDQYQVLANSLHPIENLSLQERYAISMAPVNSRNALLLRAIFIFASAHAAGLPVFINMQLPPKGVLPKSMAEFQTVCSKHNVLDLYKWMGTRFPSIECFAEKSVAEMLELESIINESLKRKIAVNGPDSISAPEHDTFDKRLLGTLNNPNGGAGVEVDEEGEDVGDLFA